MSGGKHVTETDVVKNVFDIIVNGDGEIVVSRIIKKSSKHRKDRPFAMQKEFACHKKLRNKRCRYCQTTSLFSCIISSQKLRHTEDVFEVLLAGVPFVANQAKDYQVSELSMKSVRKSRHCTTQGYVISVSEINPASSPTWQKAPEKSNFHDQTLRHLNDYFMEFALAAPDLKTLHVDNANPGVIARYPNESRQIAKSIIHYHTSGDVAALGVESVDPVVMKKNNLKASADEVFNAVRLLNEVGSQRGINGLPELLPGLNFVFGLDGETKNTFALNYEFLKKIYDNNLLLRRINLRQVIPIPGTKMFDVGEKNIRKHKSEFQRFKRKVRETIERPMLKRLLPQGTLLTQVFTETYEGKLTFARQMGSYPLLVGIPGVYPLHQFYNVKIVDYGYRSLTAVPFPLNINTAPRETLESIPGVGKKRAMRIFLKRPFHTKEELMKALDDMQIARNIEEYVQLP